MAKSKAPKKGVTKTNNNDNNNPSTTSDIRTIMTDEKDIRTASDRGLEECR